MNPYTIQPGDTLSGLATKNNTTVGSLVNLNPQVTDPNKIYAGQSLNLGLGKAAGGNTTTNVVSPAIGSYQYDLQNGLPPGTSSSGSYQGATTKSYVADTSPITAQESSIKQQLSQLGYGTSDPYIQEQQRVNTQLQDLYQQQMDSYKNQSEGQASAIATQFDTAIGSAKDEQDKELASNVVGLARIGGYLGGSASGAGAINNLNIKHRAEIAKLENDKASAIQTARNAISEKQYALAAKQLEAAKEYSKTISDRNKDMFNAYINLSQENRSQSQFVLDQGNKVLDQYVTSGKNPSPEQLVSISQSLGTTPEVIQGLFDAKRKSIELAQAQDKSEMDIKILNVLKDIPQGQYVKVGGNTYGGLKAAPATDAAGTSSSQFDAAQNFVTENKDKYSFDEMSLQLKKKYPKLTDGDVANVLKVGGIGQYADLGTASKITSAADIIYKAAENDYNKALTMADAAAKISPGDKELIKQELEKYKPWYVKLFNK